MFDPFKGCETREQVSKRYKFLVRAYNVVAGAIVVLIAASLLYFKP